LLEQLCNGEVSEEEFHKRIKKIKDMMAARAIAISSLMNEQCNDKKEHAFLNKILEQYLTSKKTKRSQYIRKSIHSIEEIFDMIGQGKIITPEGDAINTDSIRYKLFKEKGIVCIDCGLEGKFFAKEKDTKEKNEIYHFNLYGIKD